jgi:hypothetical protein
MGLNSSSRANRITDVPAAIDKAIALAKYPNVSVKLSGAVGNSLEHIQAARDRQSAALLHISP